jgi:sugar phosphate permease
MLYGLVGTRLRRRTLLAGSWLLAALPLWGLALTPGLALAAALVALRATALGPSRPLVLTVLHERTPAELRGRVLGGYRTLSIVAGPLGIVLTSAGIQRFGLVDALYGLALAALLVGVVALVNPALRDRNAPAAAAPRLGS